MTTLTTKFLKWLAREVYGSFLPVEGPALEGVENYLIDLWAKAPIKVAFIHTGLAAAVMALPLFILGRWSLYSQLSSEARFKMQREMAHSRRYLFRLICYGVRGHALVAALRDPRGRAILLPQSVPQRVAL